jgi:putative tricarboxylic transport membrane protein
MSAVFLVCALLWLIVPLVLNMRGKKVVISEEA